MISLKMPVDMEERLKCEAKAREMSMSALIRWIIREYFKKIDNE